MRRALYVMGYSNYIQNRSHDCRGLCQSSGFEGKTHRWVKAAQSNQSEGRCDTKDAQHFGEPGAPSRGPDILNFVSESRLGGLLHAPLWAGI
jgi:hypothetical protein